MSHKRRPILLLAGLGGLAGLLVATACPGGLESKTCTTYFERNEQCAARAKPEKAQMLRGLAKLARDGFKNNSNKTGIEESCQDMLANLEADPDCK